MPNHPNPSFETAGANAGEADQWTLAINFSGPLLADFGEGGIPRPVETFEGASWGTDPWSELLVGGVATVFDFSEAPQPTNFETFDRWSFNNLYAYEITGGAAATFDGGLELAEDFAHASWGTDPYAYEVTSGTTFTDSFEAPGWGTLETVVIGGMSATFELGAKTYEDFESVSADVLFVVDDPGTGLCTTPTPHGKSNGFRVTVTSTGTRPSGIAANQVFYLVNVAASSFQLSKTVGGVVWVFSDYGNGTHYLHADERVYWTLTE